MSDFGDGLSLGRLLASLERGQQQILDAIAAHHTDPGAHAAAFDAHGASPGVVEDAEEVAEDIIASAEETAEDIVEAAQDAAEIAVDAAAQATEAGLEAPAELASEAVEGAAAPAEELEEEEPSGGGEKSPARTHPLHRRVG